MPDNDVLLDLLSDPEIKSARKPETMPGRDDGEGRHGGYDLTNPNLHHGVEDTYRPFHSSGQSGSNRSVDADASQAAVSKPLYHEAGDSGPIANQAAYQGEPFSIDVSGHFGLRSAAIAGRSRLRCPPASASDAHTGVISGRRPAVISAT